MSCSFAYWRGLYLWVYILVDWTAPIALDIPQASQFKTFPYLTKPSWTIMCCSWCPWAESGESPWTRSRGITVEWFAGLCLPDSQPCPGPAAPNLWSKNKNQTQTLSGMIFICHITSTVAVTKPCTYTTEQVVGCAAAIPLTACQGYPCPLPPAASAGAWQSCLPLTCQRAWYIRPRALGFPSAYLKYFLINR